ncbi:alpha/beta hydrolase [Microbacterium sp. M3]|uniref:Alpha/beta hydrolase n=1 Tax=Microbacterium arthrosphaerae TaxID=792652 RepID=A0ABU4H3R3_9MICO|nr:MULTISPECIES: alpha/beta hydrolase [Microbacterium]MDW4573978.1 alpha/beta hydrolase [Microbacterium arthrosphaerae]MDW7607833.1 alpha/beta hydrolase [Microbacterium sp. M3]
MRTTTSADGTPIAYDETGDGPVVVIVNGAMSRAADAAGLASALTDAGFRAVTWDRRARGASGDATGSTPEREVEDLAAVIAATGGEAAVLGHSSGAVLALLAASRGVPVSALFLSEPPMRFGEDEPADDLADRLQAFVDEGLLDEAIVTFQLEGVGLPREMVEGIRASDQFAALLPLAQSTVYDTNLVRVSSTPSPEMLAVDAPVTILRGEQTFPLLLTAADRLAEAMDGAELVVVPESVMHRPDPVATARVIRARLA